MIHNALLNARTLSLIVTPGLRQSMIVMDRVQDLLSHLAPQDRHERIGRIQRTVVTFRNGSKIVALPNSPNLLRGYPAHQVLCDEAAFFRDDELVFFNVLFPMLQNTDGTFIASSTPWGKNSAFYRFAQEPNFSKHHITWRDVVEAGLAKESFIQEMERLTPPERFRREYLAEFVEDELAYFTQDLITQCIDNELQPLTDDWTRPVDAPAGAYYLGVDLGKRVDYSVVAIVRKDNEQLKLISVVRFPLETPYTTVIGHIRIICERLHRSQKVLVDETGVGSYIVEDMQHAQIPANIEGVTLTQSTKQEILGYLKQLMHTHQLSLYYDHDLITEINTERYQLTKTGQTQFSHPEGTHDDRLWALALAAYASRETPLLRYKPFTRSVG